MSIPRRPPSDHDPLPAPGSGPPLAPAPRALLVDDEAVIRQALRRFLQREGWDVDEAGDGAEALALLLGDAPAGARDSAPGEARDAGGATPATRGPVVYDLILCDLRMPGVSGMELYARLAAERPTLLARLLFTTGDPVSDGAAGFLRDTGCHVLPKPFELAEVRAHLVRLRELH